MNVLPICISISNAKTNNSKANSNTKRLNYQQNIRFKGGITKKASVIVLLLSSILRADARGISAVRKVQVYQDSSMVNRMIGIIPRPNLPKIAQSDTISKFLILDADKKAKNLNIISLNIISGDSQNIVEKVPMPLKILKKSSNFDADSSMIDGTKPIQNSGGEQNLSQNKSNLSESIVTKNLKKKGEDGKNAIIPTGKAVNRSFFRFINNIGKVISTNKDYPIDGMINQEIHQGTEKDCWLISAINAMSYTDRGRELLKEAISISADNTVAVTLKGTGETYKFTAEEVLSRSKDLSTGDLDARVLEMAVEKHRLKLLDNKRSDINYKNLSDWSYKLSKLATKKDPLNTGSGIEAFSLLSGSNADFFAVNSNSKDYKEKFEIYLNMIEHNPNYFVSFVTFRNNFTVNIDSAMNKLLRTNHLYAIKKVNDKDVILINPNNSMQEIVLSKVQLMNSLQQLQIGEYSALNY